jgi:hypothetical protein
MKKFAIHYATNYALSYNYSMYTETIEEAKKLFNQIKIDIKNCYGAIEEIYTDNEFEYYVKLKDSDDRIYIEEIK